MFYWVILKRKLKGDGEKKGKKLEEFESDCGGFGLWIYKKLEVLEVWIGRKVD